MGGLSVFDLDRTLFKGNSAYEFSTFLYNRGEWKLGARLQCFLFSVRHSFFGLSFFDLHEKAFNSLLRGRQLTRLHELTEEFLSESFEGLLFFPAVDRLKLEQDAGKHVAIFSGSADFLVQPIAKRLGVDIAEAARYGLDEEGCLSHIDFLMCGHAKVKATQDLAKRLNVDNQNIKAFSDSILDLPLLQSVGTPIVVQPDRKLQKIARKYSWEEL